MARKQRPTELPDSARVLAAWRVYAQEIWGQKVTQADLEKRIGRTQGTVSGLESGGTDYTRFHIEAYAKAFGVPPHVILSGPPGPDRPESEAIYHLHKLNADQKRMVAAMIKSLLPGDRKLKIV